MIAHATIVDQLIGPWSKAHGKLKKKEPDPFMVWAKRLGDSKADVSKDDKDAALAALKGDAGKSDYVHKFYTYENGTYLIALVRLPS